MLRTDIKALAQNIDNEILELSWKLASKVHEIAGIDIRLGKATSVPGGRHHELWIADRATLAAATAELRRNISTLEGVHQIYRWNRAWIVVTDGRGHVHTSTSCTTCYASTQFQPLPQCSGLTEEEIVKLAGERACTICYPSAPVEDRLRPTALFSRDEEEAAARRAEREAVRSTKDAAKLTVFLPGEGKAGRNETFGTVRSARSEALRAYGWALFSCSASGGNTADDHLGNFNALVTAIAEREGITEEALRTELIGKSEKKFVKEIQPAMHNVGYAGCTRAQALARLAETNKLLATIVPTTR
jgi:hypothetical protein